MAEIVKMCDMPINISLEVFKMLNPGKVEVKKYNGIMGYAIITDCEPKNLVYPEGWYYAKGNFRNKHTSTTGKYHEAMMLKTNNECWDSPYCTLYTD